MPRPTDEQMAKLHALKVGESLSYDEFPWEPNMETPYLVNAWPNEAPRKFIYENRSWKRTE
jgi:hypothetical protein